MQGASIPHLSAFIVLTALCIGLQLAPRPPNVEFTSLIVFLAGAVFGVPFGGGLGVLVMAVNGFASSWGFAGLIAPFQIVGMALVGIGGGWYGRSRHGSYDSTSFVETAVLGAFLTLVFDAITNFGWALHFVLSGQSVFLAFVNALVSGALFSLVHIVANAVVFGAAFVPITNALQKLLGGGENWKKECSPT